MLLQFIKGLLPPAAKSHVKVNCSPFHSKLKCYRHTDIQEVHLCDLGEIDCWAPVNSLSLNFQSFGADRHPYKTADDYSHEVLANKEA